MSTTITFLIENVLADIGTIQEGPRSGRGSA